MSGLNEPAHILLVEDNEGDIELTREALEDCDMGSALHVVTDGEKALNFLYKREGYEEKPKPDIILLDLNLPKTDGLSILKTIKEDEDLKKIPTIILTSSYANDDLKRGYELQVNSYHIKPCNALDYLELVQKVRDFYLESTRLS